MKLPVKQTTKLLIKAFEKTSEKKAWQLYLAKYPQMDAETYIPFEEFYKPQKKQEESSLSATEILKDVEEMLNSHDWR